MKKDSLINIPFKHILFLLTIFTFLAPYYAFAGQLNYTWDANPVEENILGYKLYFGKLSCGSTSCEYDGTSSIKGASPINITPSEVSYVLDGLEEGKWCAALTAYNDKGESGKTPIVKKAIDAVAPSISITNPTTASYLTTSGTINISGTASDNLCVESVTWINDKGSGTASGTTSWSQSEIVLKEGNNIITFTGHDSGGNTTSNTITVSYSPPLPDIEKPTVTITTPTNSPAYLTSSSSLSIAGTSSDNVEVGNITWKNNKGDSGTASGTTSWSVANIALYEGENIVTITATDTSANTATDSLTVTYTIPHGTYTKEFGNAANTDYPGTVQDTYINSGGNGGSDNYSSETQLNTYTWPTNASANRILLKWDLGAIPKTATVQNAKLYLYMLESGGDENYEISAHEIVNKNPSINTCTWNTYDGTNFWSSGKNGAKGDMSAAKDTQVIDKTLGYKTWTITSSVAKWVSDSSSNFGIILESDNTAAYNSYRLFYSSEYSDSAQRPKLVITYSMGDTTPPEGSIIVTSGVRGYTSGSTVNVSISATDVGGAIAEWGWLVLEASAAKPLASDATWVSEKPPFTYKLSLHGGDDGVKTIYMWFKDDSGNTSAEATANITLDTTPPFGSIEPKE